MTWRCEVLVSEADIQAWRDSPDPEEMSFLVSAAKRQRAEVKLTELTASERAEFKVAKEAEVSNWLKTRYCPENAAKPISPRTSSQMQMDFDLEAHRGIRQRPLKAKQYPKGQSQACSTWIFGPPNHRNSS